MTSSTFSANQATSGGGAAIDNFNSQYIVTIGNSISRGLVPLTAPTSPIGSNSLRS